MHNGEAIRLDRVLIVLFGGLLLFFILICLGLVFPKLPNVANTSSYESEDIIGQHTIEIEVDYDQIAYEGFVAELTEKYQGKEYAISLLHFTDSNKNFSINGDKVMNAASTYKLFTAYSMYKSGYVPDCLDDMIIYSDNVCPENWGQWSLTTNDAHEIGATSTRVDTMPALTTADDLVLFLARLYEGTLLSDTQTDKLLSAMKTQVFREGIPAGIPEAEVADKVGFLDGVLNDAGIIYSKKGDFALVILTNSYSWRSIADTASEIYAMI